MFLFGLGKLVYGMSIAILLFDRRLMLLPVVVLIINAIAVLSEDRFLARSTSLPCLPVARSWIARAYIEPHAKLC